MDLTLKKVRQNTVTQIMTSGNAFTVQQPHDIMFTSVIS